MADNVGYTPGSGATVAADEIGGVLFQRVKPVTGVDGTAVDVSATNPMPMAAYGELIEAVEALRMTVSALASHLQFMDSGRRAKVIFDTNSSLNQVNQVTTVLGVNTVSAVSSVTDIANIGNRPAYGAFVGMMNVPSSQIRQNISVT